MMPTLNEMGDVVLVDKLSPRMWAPIERNDVVVADSSFKKDFSVCKRVIGLPGDVIVPARGSYGVRVPEGHVWIEGDNPQNSIDSRAYGPVPVGTIQGRVVARIWPLSELQWIARGASRPSHNSIYLRAMLEDDEIAIDMQQRLAQRAAHRAQRERREATAAAAAEAAKEMAQYVDKEVLVLQEALRCALLEVQAEEEEEAGEARGEQQQEQQQAEQALALARGAAHVHASTHDSHESSRQMR
jgi:inner membrane protease subunit 1